MPLGGHYRRPPCSAPGVSRYHFRKRQRSPGPNGVRTPVSKERHRVRLDLTVCKIGECKPHAEVIGTHLRQGNPGMHGVGR